MADKQQRLEPPFESASFDVFLSFLSQRWHKVCSTKFYPPSSPSAGQVPQGSLSKLHQIQFFSNKTAKAQRTQNFVVAVVVKIMKELLSRSTRHEIWIMRLLTNACNCSKVAPKAMNDRRRTPCSWISVNPQRATCNLQLDRANSDSKQRQLDTGWQYREGVAGYGLAMDNAMALSALRCLTFIDLPPASDALTFVKLESRRVAQPHSHTMHAARRQHRKEHNFNCISSGG